jgi:hypothetical protein
MYFLLLKLQMSFVFNSYPVMLEFHGIKDLYFL